MSASDINIVGRVITRLRDMPPPSAADEPRKPKNRKKAATKLDSQPSTTWPYAGFAPMTRITTSFGEVYAAALRKGDLVKTRTGEFLPVVWLDRIQLDEAYMAKFDDAHPILLPQGSVARGLPRAPVMLSPRQIVSQQGDFREPREAFELLERPTVRRRHEDAIAYTLFHLGQTADVYCEGLLVRVEV